MSFIENWGAAVNDSVINLWTRFIEFLPNLIGAILVFIIGYFIAVILGKLVRKILQTLQIDQAIEKTKIKERFESSGVKLNIAKIGEDLTKWLLILVFLAAATDILGWNQVTAFFITILAYIPNIIIAIIILIVAALIADFLSKAVKGSVMVAKVSSANVLASATRWTVLIFAALMALDQLGMEMSLIKILFTGLVAMVAIAGGLAFGLGGKDLAGDFLKDLKKDVSEEKSTEEE